jgi:hypothetical protein
MAFHYRLRLLLKFFYRLMINLYGTCFLSRNQRFRQKTEIKIPHLRKSFSKCRDFSAYPLLAQWRAKIGLSKLYKKFSIWPADWQGFAIFLKNVPVGFINGVVGSFLFIAFFTLHDTWFCLNLV